VLSIAPFVHHAQLPNNLTFAAVCPLFCIPR
jgi:hypothetical protein